MLTMNKVGAFILPLALLACSAVAQQDFSKIEFRQVPVADGLLMLQGAGGNIAALPGDDGLLIIDDDYTQMEDKLMATLETIDSNAPRFVLNTHWHFDHAGGNQKVGRSGATIVAHENVRARLRSGGHIKAFSTDVPPADRSALPAITYADAMTMHWNDYTLKLSYAQPAHTDGDTVVYLYRNDLLTAVHLGDLFFNGFYPFIDASSGGSAMGVVKGVESVLAKINDDTVVIPGHGPLATKADLQHYHDFLKSAVSRIAALKASGQSVEQIVDAKPLEDFEAEWGDGFLKTDVWIAIVFAAI
ncbi:MAG: MBL fold metallo-hydrolase [Cellvibrionaceae bacterium]